MQATFLLDKAEVMTRRDEDRQWVLGQIREDLRPFTELPERHGIKKLLHSLRQWAILGPLITATVAISLFIGNDISKDSEFRGTTTEHLKNIDRDNQTLSTSVGTLSTKIDALSTTVEALRLRQASATPTNAQSIKEAQNVLQAAQVNKVQFTNETIANAGKLFVAAAKNNPGAWDAVLNFLNYRAYLNSVTIQLGPQVPAPFETEYQTTADNFPRKVTLMWIGTSKPPDVRLRPLSSPDLNKNATTGPSLLLADAPVVVLDNLDAKKVVFRNSHIIYRGGRVALDEVYFVNCTFEMDRQSRGQQLANQILSGTSTTFMVS
jgi:outer membrane murein-binding lipoprotein Lpp